MKKNKIFITGSGGQLAKSIIEIIPEYELYLGSKEKLDVTNKKQVLKEIGKFKPDIVFHFASMTRGEECAKNPEKAHQVNVEGTRNVVNACIEHDSSILFVSTNEVFDGKKKSPYIESDKPNPITVAGKTKYEAEKIITENLKKYFVVRTSWLYSKWSRNFLFAVLEQAADSKKLKVVSDEISSPTSTKDLAEALKKLILTNKYGTYHLSNSGSASRYEFAKKAIELMSYDEVEMTKINHNDFERLSYPPLYSPLKNTKAKKLGIIMPKWESALKKYLISEGDVYGKN